MKIYKPSAKALAIPRRVRIPKGNEKIWVGVGGDIEIKRNPPKKSEIIKEATPAQYKWLFENKSPLVVMEEVKENAD